MHRRFLFILDPLERILPDRDTTFVFMREAQRRGIEVYACTLEQLFARGPRPYARARRIALLPEPPHFARYEERTEPLEFFHAVFMRKDPPFDQAYFFATHLLSLADPAATFVLNSPRGLREANEKLYALHFPSLIPPTLVTADPNRIKDFVAEQGGQAILKPLDACGGTGIFLAALGDRNLNALLELSTHDGRRYLMAQRYLPEARTGDKRILILDGEPLGAILRVPRADDHRGNIHVGGTVLPVELTARDLEIVATLAPRLRADGLYFVGIDVIGHYLTEVNVTSPTGIQEHNRLYGTELEAAVIDFVLRRLPSQ